MNDWDQVEQQFQQPQTEASQSPWDDIEGQFKQARAAQASVNEKYDLGPIVGQLKAARESQAAVVNVVAQMGDADKAARADEIGKQLGLPGAAVLQNLSEFEQRLAIQKTGGILAQSPGLQDWLIQNPESAIIAKDDYERLSTAEKLMRAVSTGWDDAALSNERGRLGYSQMSGAATDADRTRMTEIDRTLADRVGGIGGFYRVVNTVSGLVSGMWDSAQRAAPVAAGGMAVGGALGAVGGPLAPVSVPAGMVVGTSAGFGAGMFGDMFKVAAGNLYSAIGQAVGADGRPVDEVARQGAALLGGIVVGALNTWGLKVGAAPFAAVAEQMTTETIARALSRPTVAQAVGKFAADLGKSGGTGAVLGLVTEGANIAAEQAARMASSGEFATVMNDPGQREMALSRMVLSAVDMALGMAALHTVPLGATMTSDLARVRRADLQAQQFQALGDSIKASTLRARSEDVFQSWADHAAPTDSAVYIPAERFIQYFQNQGMDPLKVADHLGIDRSQVSDGLKSGGDVSIPMSQYVGKVAGSDHHAGLIPDIRMSPDEMTPREAEDFKASAPQMVGDALAAAEATGRGVNSADMVADDVRQKLIAAGQHGDVAEKDAALWGARYRVRGERLGVDPLELYRQTDLQILNRFSPAEIDRAAGELGFNDAEKAAASWAIEEMRKNGTADQMEGRQGVGGGQVGGDGSGAATVGKAGSRFTQPDDGSSPKRGGTDGSEGARGDVRFPATGFGTGPTMVGLFEKANLSTFLHESGHVFLEELRLDASRADAPEQIRHDWQAVKSWLGVTDDLAAQHHETWARGFEHYLMEGKAPSVGLQSIFARFAAWLGHIYRTARGLNVEMTDEIRGVMDRLLASDEEIDAARARTGQRPLFRTAEEAAKVGMTPDEHGAYLKAAQESSDAARSELVQKKMAEIARHRESWWRDEASKVKAEVEAELDQRPEYRALALMKDMRLDRADIERLGVDVKDLPKTVPPLWVKTGGSHPDVVAELAGFRTGSEMLTALKSTATRGKLVREMVDQRMEERFGPKEDGSAAEQALAAVHNDLAGTFIETELKALARRATTVEYGGKRWAVGPKTTSEVARQVARDMIGRKRVADATRLGQYATAELRSAREAERALASGDFEAAATAKRKQLLQHALYAEAKKAAEDIDHVVNLAGRLGKDSTREKIADSYLEQIDGLLDRFDLRRGVTLKAIEKRKALAAWAAEQEAAGNEVAIPADLLNESRRQSYKDMTVEEVRGLGDALRNILHLGRLKQTLLDNKERRDFDELVNEAIDQLAGLKQRPLSTNINPTAGEKVAGVVRGVDAMLTKPEQIIDWLDSNNPNGVFNRIVFRRIKDAQVRANDLQIEITSSLKELHAGLGKEFSKDLDRRYEVPELPNADGEATVFRKRDLLAVALNLGNESNFDKLLRGYHWTEENVRAVLERHLSQADWRFVQGIWDTFESLWPRIAEMQKRLSGVEPDKVDARGFQISTVDGVADLRGGYFPVMYDPLKSWQAEVNRERSANALFENQYQRATTPKGHTISRTEYAAPLHLDLDGIPFKLGQAIHDLAFREAIMDADKFMQDNRIREAIERTLGREAYQQFRPWLQHIANERNVDARGLAWFDRFLHELRINSMIVGIGFRVSTMLKHGTTALMNSIGEVGPVWMGKATAEFFGTPEKMRRTWDMVLDKSGEMRHRMNEIDRDTREALRDLTGQQGWKAAAARYGHYGVAMLDMASAVPTWLAAYRKAVAGGLSEADAVYAADKQVRKAHGAQGSPDMAAIQRGSEAQKLFTMFYGFFNHVYNRQRDAVRIAGHGVDAVKGGDWVGARRDFAMVLSRSWFYLAAPALIEALVSEGAPDGEDETWGHWAAKAILGEIPAGIPVMRDLAKAAISGRHYEMSPVGKALDSLLVLGKDAGAALGLSDHEVSDRWLRHAIETPGYVFGLPTGQPAGTIQYLWDVSNGDENPDGALDFIRGLAFGPSHKKH
ncbi:Phage protein [Paramagnetospirillum magnetotacticum MS-1]|uniref:Phage protein n=1 Tax=Paramagnetospirillum magnetotacticum MS-1 TaxID=272627 RepID=A0A0C2YUM8_PARME|nr:hypothetical protein [Paramagnetospirillum magnetotacticum]KIL98828.1 Phage protein [Paramagnetospirillum magnetotacticum MS-1]